MPAAMAACVMPARKLSHVCECRVLSPGRSIGCIAVSYRCCQRAEVKFIRFKAIDLIGAESSTYVQLPNFSHMIFLTGYGPTAGAAMTESPLVDKISFTGSTGDNIIYINIA
jgi:hypothetical protein